MEFGYRFDQADYRPENDAGHRVSHDGAKTEAAEDTLGQLGDDNEHPDGKQGFYQLRSPSV